MITINGNVVNINGNVVNTIGDFKTHLGSGMLGSEYLQDDVFHGLLREFHARSSEALFMCKMEINNLCNGNCTDMSMIGTQLQRIAHQWSNLSFGGKWYLQNYRAEPKRNELIQSARRFASAAQPAQRCRIFARAMILSLIFDRPAEDLLEGLPAEWSDQTLADRIIDVTQQNVFHFSLRDFDENAPLTRVQLHNPDDTVREICIKYPLRDRNLAARGSKTIRMPAGSSLWSLFVGDTLTCLKGSIVQSGGSIYVLRAQADMPVARFDTLDHMLHRVDPGKPPITDLVPNGEGFFHQMRGSDLVLNCDGRETEMSGVLGVFASASTYVILCFDGSTQSNLPQMRGKRLVSVLPQSQGFFFCDEKGKLLSTWEEGGALDEETYFRRMTDCFPGADSSVAQRVPLLGGQGDLVYAADGTVYINRW